MKRVLKITLGAILLFFILSIGSVIIYKYIPIPGTPLMLIRNIEEGTPINYQWTPIEEINPDLALAVVASEDNLFMQHNGFDFKQIEIARKEAEAGANLTGTCLHCKGNVFKLNVVDLSCLGKTSEQACIFL